MNLLGEEKETVLFKTILFDNTEEKLKIAQEMELEGWEDLENGKGALRVVFKKYINE